MIFFYFPETTKILILVKSEKYKALASISQWVERWPMHWGILGSITSQGHVPRLWVRSLPPDSRHM